MGLAAERRRGVASTLVVALSDVVMSDRHCLRLWDECVVRWKTLWVENGMLCHMQVRSLVPVYQSTPRPIYIRHTPHIKLPGSAEVLHSKLQWVRDFDSCTRSPGHTVNYNGSVTFIHPFQLHGTVVSKICQLSTTLLWQDCTDRSLWQGSSDKVTLTSTSYSSNKHSANFGWPTLTTYSTLDPGILAVTNRIRDNSGPQGPTNPFSTAFVEIWGPNH